jgi:hypothetical protein
MWAALWISRKKWKWLGGIIRMLDERRFAFSLASGGTMVKSSKMANT